MNTIQQKHRTHFALWFACLPVLMLGVAYASVPLYRMFCEATGFDGTPKRAAQMIEPINTVPFKQIDVKFDGNVAGTLPWQFAPKQPSVTIRVGEPMHIDYRARNMAARATTGTATFNILPAAAAKYFNKVQCFCFEEQTLKSGESIDMPVTFFIDPDILKDEDVKNIHTITLSYTFFPTKTVLKQSSLN